MRSFQALAVCLSLSQISNARVPHSFRDLVGRDAEPEPEPQTGLMHWISRLFKRVAQSSSTDGTCYEDGFYDFVDTQPGFCQQYLSTPNVTATVDYTPTETETYVFTTFVSTANSLARFTPQSTVTVTITPGASQAKREAEPEITARTQLNVDDVFQMWRRQNSAANSSSLDSAALSRSFSSACSCRDYPGQTVTATYTNDPVVVTLSAFDRTTTTVGTTTTAAARVVTITVTAETSSTETPSSGSSTSETSEEPSTTTSSNGEPTPTSPPFTCPDDNNTTVSQLVGNERFDYLILCDTVLMDTDFYGGSLMYSSFGQCASACSIANANFSFPVCQGVSYYATGSETGNCFLKSTANHTTSADGVDSALLQRIALGVTNSSASGTTTDAAPFADETMTIGPEEASSSVSSILSNSTETMPIVTPYPLPQSGMLVNAPGGVYSTYISTGTTYSSGTAYSFATTFSDGSWYMTYFTSYSVAWATATTVYEATESGYQEVGSSDSSSQQTNNADGGYNVITTTTNEVYGPNGVNTTEVISDVGYDRNGTEISSTATTNYYYSAYATGTGASGGPGSTGLVGGAAGGASGGAASGSPITSTVYSTQTIIYSSGGTAGASGTAASGGPTPAPPTPSATTITFGTGYSSGFAASGGPTGTGGAESGAASGIVTSTGPLTPISSTVNSGGTVGETGGAASGGPAGTGGASSGEASGAPNTTSTGTYTGTNDLRSGTYSTTTTSPLGIGSPSGSSSIPLFNSTGGVYTFSTGTAGASSTEASRASNTMSMGTYTGTNDLRSGTYSTTATSPSSGTYTGTNDLRSGTYSTTTSIPLGTGSLSPYGPFPTGPAPYSSGNNTLPVGTSPPGNLPSALQGYSHPGTAPSSSPYTNALDSRSGTIHPTAPSGYTPPNTTPGTGTAPSSSLTMSSNSTVSGMSGTGPSSTSSHRTRSHPGETVAPVSQGPPPSGSGTMSHPPLLTVTPSTCANMTMGTTTVFSTVTVLGCYAQCPQGTGGGYYGPGPQSFGPPVFATGEPPKH